MTLADILDAQRSTAVDSALAELAGWHEQVRAQFPALRAAGELAYLDSAATAQKPQAVLDAVLDYLSSRASNAGRGTYPWANATTAMVEDAGRAVRRFLGDDGGGTGDFERSTVHFSSGTSAGLRSVALDWLVEELGDGDEIIVPFADHQANALPWLEAVEQLTRRGVHVTVHDMPYEPASKDYDQSALAGLVNERTRFVAATHVHHVYGVDMNVHRVRATVGPDVVICLDAAQGIGHAPLSVAELDVDFVVFSGHKAMALPGSGAVWARGARGRPHRPGGWSGSPDTTGALSITAALDWLDRTGVDRIARWTTALGARLTDGLAGMASYEVLGCQESLHLDSRVQRRQGIVSFRHRAMTSNDLGFVLASHGLMVRADGHCQARAGEEESSVRVSLHAYSSVEEVDRLLTVLAELDGAA